MKQRLIALRNQIDARSVRERVMLFACAAALIVFLVWSAMLSPLLARQASLRAEISQQRNNMMGIDAEITATVLASRNDPDAQARAQLAELKAQTGALNAQLRTMQTRLVPPDRMGPVLETILRSHGRLRLVGLKTAPVSPLIENDPAKGIFRHGVEVTVRGNYLDLVNYMSALEAMPAQLFWARASLDVEEYPNARLTLTLFTLSLDEKWMTL